MAKEGKTSKTYSSAARTSVPPPTARSGRRPTFLGRLFMRASVLLVASHLLPGESGKLPTILGRVPDSHLTREDSSSEPEKNLR